MIDAKNGSGAAGQCYSFSHINFTFSAHSLCLINIRLSRRVTVLNPTRISILIALIMLAACGGGGGGSGSGSGTVLDSTDTVDTTDTTDNGTVAISCVAIS